MNTPYMVLSHQKFCTVCKRAVEDEEVAVNDDDLSVHLGCGAVLEERGHRSIPGSNRCEGKDLAVIDAFNGCEADWLASQRAILEALPGPGKADPKRQAVLQALDNASHEARMQAAAAGGLAVLTRGPGSITAGGPSVRWDQLVSGEPGKRRRGLPPASVDADEEMGDCD
eukprot:TRINITY_DN9359_c0_g1_i1.p1 TRINITY_DN9359_c0_g1~~TRINITY_DN9359_c0_g1_i1.p1  ORF type:complete len:170 (+),score=41.78 TRINITY_DN9359_c0_g1_i1:137-646(+)